MDTAGRGRRRRAALGAACALALALIAALAWQPVARWLRPPPTPTEKLTLAVSVTYPGSGLIHVAIANGYFAAAGLEVTLQPHTSGRSALEAVVAQQADIATVGDTPFMFALTQQVPVSLVATIANAARSHGIVARRDRGIAVAADLRGRTVAVTERTDAHFLLSVIAAGGGVQASEVNVERRRPEEMASALAAGQVDAIATWEPWLTNAREAVGDNAVVFLAEGSLTFGFHLAGRSDFVRAHPVAMQRLLRALLRAEADVTDRREHAKALIRTATGADPARFDAAWPNFSLKLGLSQGLLNMLEDQARWAIARGYAPGPAVPDFLAAIYLDAMLAVHPRAVSIVH